MIFTKPYADALIVLLVILLFFGPKRLPSLGKSLGQGFREFKDGITGHSKDSDAGEHPELQAATPNPAPAKAAPAQQPAAAHAEQQPASVSAPGEQTQPQSGSQS